MIPLGDMPDLRDVQPASAAESGRAGLRRRLEQSLLRLGIECRVEENEVTLSGVVSSYYEKQVAQEIVMKLGRFLRVRNRCEVKREKQGSESID